MRAMLLGIRRVDMVDENKRSINGFSCHMSYPADGVEGQAVIKKFVSDSLCSSCGFSPRLGQVEIDVGFNGNLSSICMIDAK